MSSHPSLPAPCSSLLPHSLSLLARTRHPSVAPRLLFSLSALPLCPPGPDMAALAEASVEWGWNLSRRSFTPDPTFRHAPGAPDTGAGTEAGAVVGSRASEVVGAAVEGLNRPQRCLQRAVIGALSSIQVLALQKLGGFRTSLEQDEQVLAALEKCKEWVLGASEREVKGKVRQGLNGGDKGQGGEGDTLSRLAVTALKFSFNFGLGTDTKSNSDTDSTTDTDSDTGAKGSLPPLLTPQKASLCGLETLLTLEETQLAVRHRRHKKQILRDLHQRISAQVTNCPRGGAGGRTGACELQFLADVMHDVSQGDRGEGEGVRGGGASGVQGEGPPGGQAEECGVGVGSTCRAGSEGAPVDLALESAAGRGSEAEAEAPPQVSSPEEEGWEALGVSGVPQAAIPTGLPGQAEGPGGGGFLPEVEAGEGEEYAEEEAVVERLSAWLVDQGAQGMAPPDEATVEVP